MLKFVIPAVAALGLTAVAAQSYAPAVETAAPAEMGWHVSHEGAMAKLAYGVANSDQLALMITCEPGQPMAVVYGDVQPAEARLTRASLGPSEMDAMSGGDAYETRVSLRDPAMRTLARQGSIEVRGDAGEFRLGATDDERRGIAGFFAYCDQTRA